MEDPKMPHELPPVEIHLSIPLHLLSAIEKYTAKHFFEITTETIRLALLRAIFHQIESESIELVEESTARILDAHRVKSAEALTKLRADYVRAKQAATTEGTPEPQKVEVLTKLGKSDRGKKDKNIPPSVKAMKELTPPPEMRQDKRTHAYWVWGWVVCASLNTLTVGGNGAKFHTFTIDNVIQGLLKDHKHRVKDKTAYSALTNLINGGWITAKREVRNGNSVREYALTSAAEKWVLTAKNQQFLISQGFLKPVGDSESDIIH